MLSKSLPFLPGYIFSDPEKTNFRKEQIFNYRTKTCLEKPRLLEPVDPYTLSSLKNFTLASSVDTGASVTKKTRTAEPNLSFPNTLPAISPKGFKKYSLQINFLKSCGL